MRASRTSSDATAAGHDVIVAARRAANGNLVASSMRLD
jgi:hypothetical protein